MLLVASLGGLMTTSGRLMTRGSIGLLVIACGGVSVTGGGKITHGNGGRCVSMIRLVGATERDTTGY